MSTFSQPCDGAPSGLNLCRLAAKSLNSYVHPSCCLEGTVSLESSCLSFFVAPPSPRWRGLMKTSHLGLGVLDISQPLYIAQLWISVLSPISCKSRFLWWWLSEALIASRIALGVILLLFFPSRAIVFGFLLYLYNLSSVRYEFYLMKKS